MPTPEDPHSAAPHGVRRRILRWVALAIGLPVGLLATLVAALNVDPVGTWFAARVAARLVPSGLELEVERVGGSWLRSLRLTGVGLSDEDGPVLVLDTLRIDYRLLPLLRSRVEIRSLGVSGAYLRLRRSPDGTLGLPGFGSTSAAASGSDAPSSWRISMDSAVVRGLAGELVDGAPAGPGTLLSWAEGEANVRDLRLDSGLSLRARRAAGRFGFPSSPAGRALGPLQLRVAGAWSAGRIAVDTLEARAGGGRVSAAGTLSLPATDSEPEPIDLGLHADRFPLAPLHALLGHRPDGSVRLDGVVRIRGTTGAPTGVVDLTVGEGRIDGTVTAAVGDAGPAGLTAALTAVKLDPGALTGDTARAGRIDARMDVALEGPGRRRLGGHARVEVSRLALPGVPLAGATLDSDWSDGSASVHFETRGRAGSVRLAGEVRPLAARPTWDLRGPVELELPEGVGSPGRMVGEVVTRGEGVDLDSAEVDLTLAVSEMGLRGARLDTATLRARLAAGNVAWELEARDTGVGTLIAGGSAVLASSPDSRRTFRLDSAVVRTLDVAGLLGDSVESRLDARLTASGELGRPEAADATLSAAVGEVRYGSFRADTVAVEARLARGRAGAVVRLRSPAGNAEADLSARPFLSRPEWTLHRLDFQDLDVAGVGTGAAADPPLTRLDGTLAGTVRGGSADALEGELRLTLDSSTVNRQALAGGRGRLDLSGGEARLRLELDPIDRGRVVLEARGRPLEPRPSLGLERLTFRGIDPLAWAGMPSDGPLQALLQGSATGRLDGLDPATLDAAATIRLDDSRFNEASIEEGRIDLRVADGGAEGEADVTLGHGRWSADAEARWAGDSTVYALSSRLDTEAPGRLLGRSGPLAPGRLDATVTVEGRGLAPGRMDTRLRLVADSAVLGRIRADTLRLAAGLRDGVLVLDTFRVRSNVLDARGRGRLPLNGHVGDSSSLALDATAGELAPLAPWVGVEPLALGTGDLEVTVEGPPGAPRFVASARASAALLGSTELAGLDLRVEGRLDSGIVPDAADIRMELDRLTVAGLDVRRTTLDAAWSGEEFTLDGESIVDDRRDLRFSVRADPRASRSRATLQRLDVRVDDDRWALAGGTPSLSWGDGFTVDSLRLEAPDQALVVAGGFDPGGDSDLRAGIENLRIGGVADLVGLDALDGTLTSSLRFEGPTAEPRVEAELEAELRRQGGAGSAVTATLTYDSLRLDLDAAVEDADGGTLAVSGHLPVDWRAAAVEEADGGTAAPVRGEPGSVDLTLDARDFDVAWAGPFLGAGSVRGLAGRLDATAGVRGTSAAPLLSGSLRLRDGGATVPGLGVTYEAGVADLTLDDAEARLDSAVVRTDDGVVRVAGTLSLPELTLGSFDLRAELDRFQAIDNDAFRVRASGSGALVGTTDAPKIEGDLRLVETDVYLGDAVPSGSSVQAIELTEAQIRELEETLGYPVRREDDAPPGALFRALSLELSVAASRDTWVRQRANPELEIQLTGDVDVSKEPGDSLRLDGRVEAVPRRSWVEQFGRRFRIEEGVVDFRGTVPRTRIDVRAAYEVPTTRDDQPEATITLDLEGTPQDLSLTAGSDPPMENADILSYLATGRPAASSLDVQGEGGEGGLGTVGSEFALGQVAGLVEGLAAEGVGLDVVDIRTDGLRGATVVAGRYVTPELYVGFKQPVGRDGDASEPGTSFDQTEVEVELQALRWLLLNMEASNSALRLLLRFRRAY